LDLQIFQIVISVISPLIYVLFTWWLTSRPQQKKTENDLKREFIEELGNLTEEIIDQLSADNVIRYNDVIIFHKKIINVATLMRKIDLSLMLNKRDKDKLNKYIELLEDWNSYLSDNSFASEIYQDYVNEVVFNEDKENFAKRVVEKIEQFLRLNWEITEIIKNRKLR